jgi:hypothetical protein
MSQTGNGVYMCPRCARTCRCQQCQRCRQCHVYTREPTTHILKIVEYAALYKDKLPSEKRRKYGKRKTEDEGPQEVSPPPPPPQAKINLQFAPSTLPPTTTATDHIPSYGMQCCACKGMLGSHNCVPIIIKHAEYPDRERLLCMACMSCAVNWTATGWGCPCCKQTDITKILTVQWQTK